jgi:hypothetical protein
LAEEEKFHFLTNAAFELLTQPEKLAYLSDAMDALHGNAHGWSSLFTILRLEPCHRMRPQKLKTDGIEEGLHKSRSSFPRRRESRVSSTENGSPPARG